MTLEEKFKFFVEMLKNNIPTTKTELIHRNPFELLIAVILSAQCKDSRVNMVTPILFEKYPDAFSMSLADYDDVCDVIKSITFPNAKATNIINASRRLYQFYLGKVPNSISELEQLPGVGRKTANVVASVAFDIPALGVDTHVIRISNRLGLSMGSVKPDEIERILTKWIPKDLWASAHHWIVLHGRYKCFAKNPNCEGCIVKEICIENKEKIITKKRV